MACGAEESVVGKVKSHPTAIRSLHQGHRSDHLPAFRGQGLESPEQKQQEQAGKEHDESEVNHGPLLLRHEPATSALLHRFRKEETPAPLSIGCGHPISSDSAPDLQRTGLVRPRTAEPPCCCQAGKGLWERRLVTTFLLLWALGFRSKGRYNTARSGPPSEQRFRSWPRSRYPYRLRSRCQRWSPFAGSSSTDATVVRSRLDCRSDNGR